ncbi:unnamed protein product [Ranitomeya imitator]|uniref:Ubiquitin carboxyl-terminal hydrolase MINDY n=1 Tax=Ranitomeya imitator TaxID=111125 RepID=A0ABN9MJJ5_9NEOB|nr:unnamed protein product [Ranitomeya imitator]
MSESNKELVNLVWGEKNGKGLVDSIFSRWTQGFVFSVSEPTALEQFEGGPCAVIAPVQAFLLKNLLFTSEKSHWRTCQEDDQKDFLCQTFCDILEMTGMNNASSYCLTTWQKGKTTPTPERDLPAESSRPGDQPSKRLPVTAVRSSSYPVLTFST